MADGKKGKKAYPEKALNAGFPSIARDIFGHAAFQSEEEGPDKEKWSGICKLTEPSIVELLLSTYPDRGNEPEPKSKRLSIATVLKNEAFREALFALSPTSRKGSSVTARDKETAQDEIRKFLLSHWGEIKGLKYVKNGLLFEYLRGLSDTLPSLVQGEGESAEAFEARKKARTGARSAAERELLATLEASLGVGAEAEEADPVGITRAGVDTGKGQGEGDITQAGMNTGGGPSRPPAAKPARR